MSDDQVPPPPPALPPPPPPIGYPAEYPGAYATPPIAGRSTNGFAIASLVLGIVGPLACGIPAVLALVFGFIARQQIKASGGMKSGRGMATAGIVLGCAWFGLLAVILIVSATSGPN